MESELDPGTFKIVFGGQYDVIQRVVNGIDLASYASLGKRFDEIITRVREQAEAAGKAINPDFELPEFDSNLDENNLFGGNFGGVQGVFADVGSLSEQAAINFVEFLVWTMIRAQEFSDRIPTVGGDIHIALINRTEGFRWISKEEFKFGDHSVPRYTEALT